jgi:hypothetical protein
MTRMLVHAIFVANEPLTDGQRGVGGVAEAG